MGKTTVKQPSTTESIKKEYEFKYLNNYKNIEYNDIIKDFNSKVEVIVHKFHCKYDPNREGKFSWRGEKYIWYDRMSEIQYYINKYKDDLHFYRWWLDKYIDEGCIALYNYLFDRGQYFLLEDDISVSSRKRKSVEQKTDEMAEITCAALKEYYK